MLFKSQVYTQASGSIGGITYSRNKGGMYTRARATPTNPNTERQAFQRSIMAEITAAWMDPTKCDKPGWKTFAESVSVTNRLGESIFISALAWLQKANGPRLTTGLSGKYDPAPTNFNLCEFSTPVGLALDNTGSLQFTIKNSDEWAQATGGALLVFVSPPKNPTINFYKGPFRYLNRVNGAATPPINGQTMALADGVQEGQKVFVRFVATAPDGRPSAEYVAPVTVGP